MAHASSRLSSTFSCRQKDFCFFCSSRRTQRGQGTDFSLHSEWKTAPQLSHLQEPTMETVSQNAEHNSLWDLSEAWVPFLWTALSLGRGITERHGCFQEAQC